MNGRKIDVDLRRRPVGGREQDRRPGPGAEQARVHDREQLAVRVPHVSVPARRGRPDDRRRLRRHLLRRARQREHPLRRGGNVVERQRRHLRRPAETDEEDGRHEGRRARATASPRRPPPRRRTSRSTPCRRSGLKPVYTNTTVDFGSTDVGPQVLGIKNAGADAVYLPLVANSNLAVVQGLAQNGVKMKSAVLATGYGQPLLDQPVSKTFGPTYVLATGYAPVELKTKATKQFQADLKKYAERHGRARLRHLHRLHHLRHGDRGVCRMPATRPPGPRSSPASASSAPTTRPGWRASRSTSASRPTARLRRRSAAGTCRSRTASSCRSPRTASRSAASSSEHRPSRPPPRLPRRSSRRSTRRDGPSRMGGTRRSRLPADARHRRIILTFLYPLAHRSCA